MAAAQKAQQLLAPPARFIAAVPPPPPPPPAPLPQSDIRKGRTHARSQSPAHRSLQPAAEFRFPSSNWKTPPRCRLSRGSLSSQHEVTGTCACALHTTAHQSDTFSLLARNGGAAAPNIPRRLLAFFVKRKCNHSHTLTV